MDPKDIIAEVERLLAEAEADHANTMVMWFQGHAKGRARAFKMVLSMLRTPPIPTPSSTPTSASPAPTSR